MWPPGQQQRQQPGRLLRQTEQLSEARSTAQKDEQATPNEHGGRNAILSRSEQFYTDVLKY
jgi:hypothetical protein